MSKIRVKNWRTAIFTLALCMFTAASYGQSSSTGAVAGTVTDPGGAVVPNATVTVTDQSTNATRTVTSGSQGEFNVPLLPPGMYTVKIGARGFASIVSSVEVKVTETATLPIHLSVGAASENVTVTTDAGAALKTEESDLGDVVNQASVSTLPLMTRNFGEILGLSAGVATPLQSANELGRGSASGEGGPSPTQNGSKNIDGGRNTDNNFMINGLQVNDLVGLGGSFPVPNPDTIQEFKVVTGQYDASYGRNAGAQVNIVTRNGGNHYHATLFEYFRNEDLNANDYFRKSTLKPRGLLRQNQYGATGGGPVIPQHLFIFGSWQGTKQLNGIATGCSAFIAAAPAALSNNRSAAALGAAFAGLRGAQDPGTGVTIAANGSNISAPALALLNAKLPNGQFIVPTPQTLSGGVGQASFSLPCTYQENQYQGNIDYTISQKDTVAVRAFAADEITVTNFSGGANVPGLGVSRAHNNFRVGSIAETHVFSSNLVNQVSYGLYTSDSESVPAGLIGYSDIGVNDVKPFLHNMSISISGSYSVISPSSVHGVTDQFGQEVDDNLTWVKGAHTFHFGGNFLREQDLQKGVNFNDTLTFLSFADFLLGLPAGPTASGGNGTNFSNVSAAKSVYEENSLNGVQQGPLLGDRNLHVPNVAGFVQDDWKALRDLTLNLGLRWEFRGVPADYLGRLAYANLNNFQTDPTGLTYQGFVVGHNYDKSLSPLPAGVAVSANDSGLANVGENIWNPRFGFAWAPLNKAVIRGGYGVYSTQGVFISPYSATQQGAPWAGTILAGSSNTVNTSSFANPYPNWQANPTVTELPVFQPYGCTSACGTPTAAYTSYTNFFIPQNWRSGYMQTFSLNTQYQAMKNLVVTVGYVGTRTIHLPQAYHANQPMIASPSNPIRGVTTNTPANLTLRRPYLGLSNTMEATRIDGYNNYNALQASVQKQLSHGLQLLASYTWSKDLDTKGPMTSQVIFWDNQGNTPGSNYLPRRLYGPTDYNRPNVFVLNYTYAFPTLTNGFEAARLLLNGWEAAGVTRWQSGTSITLFGLNSNNAAGQALDLLHLTGTCKGLLDAPGKVQSKVGGLFNTTCMDKNYPVIDPSGMTGFGNGGIGNARGPDQNNTDVSFIKHFNVPKLGESSNVEFRSEFFNVFNHAQFMNPNNDGPIYEFGASGFGAVSGTSVNARIVQFALRLSY